MSSTPRSSSSGTASPRSTGSTVTSSSGSKPAAAASEAGSVLSVISDSPVQFLVAAAGVVAHVLYLKQGYDRMVKVGTANPLGTLGVAPTFEEPAIMVAAYATMVAAGLATSASRAKDVNTKAGMLVYNSYETVLSAGMFYVLVSEIIGAGYNPLDYTMKADRSEKGNMLAFGLWVNYQSKFIEFFDTFFMLVRNTPSSLKQVSPLHVVHHAIMGPIMWLIITQCPGGGSYFGPAINSFIHTVMYGYYLATSIGVKFPVAVKQSITVAQITQFFVILTHSLFNIYVNVTRHVPKPTDTLLDTIMGTEQYWPPILSYVELALMILMVYMFSGFFVSAYSGKEGSKGGSKAAAAAGKAE